MAEVFKLRGAEDIMIDELLVLFDKSVRVVAPEALATAVQSGREAVAALDLPAGTRVEAEFEAPTWRLPDEQRLPVIFRATLPLSSRLPEIEVASPGALGVEGARVATRALQRCAADGVASLPEPCLCPQGAAHH